MPPPPPDPASGSPAPPGGAAEALSRLDEITRRLRRECPWDREQDARSIVPHTVEEAYELADAAARDDVAGMHDELGDVLFQVVFLSLLLEERGEGDLGSVAQALTEKLIRRHPHVFGEARAETAGEVLGQWERIKREVEGDPESARDPLASIPDNLPSLTYARKVLRRLDPQGSATEDKPGGPAAADADRERAEAEVGEELLDAVRRARELGVDPELALRAACRRYAEAARG